MNCTLGVICHSSEGWIRAVRWATWNGILTVGKLFCDQQDWEVSFHVFCPPNSPGTPFPQSFVSFLGTLLLLSPCVLCHSRGLAGGAGRGPRAELRYRTSLGLLRVLLGFGTGLFPPSTPLIFISLEGSFSSCQLCLRGFKVQKFYIFKMNKWTDSQPDAVVNLRKGKCFPTASFIYEIITEPLIFMHVLELSV